MRPLFQRWQVERCRVLLYAASSTFHSPGFCLVTKAMREQCVLNGSVVVTSIFFFFFAMPPASLPIKIPLGDCNKAFSLEHATRIVLLLSWQRNLSHVVPLASAFRRSSEAAQHSQRWPRPSPVRIPYVCCCLRRRDAFERLLLNARFLKAELHCELEGACDAPNLSARGGPSGAQMRRGDP